MAEVNRENFVLFEQKANDIDSRLDRIHEDTSYYSSLAPIREHKCFEELVAMGNKIIPYLFYRMTQYGCQWTHLLLLSELAGDEVIIPEDHRGRFTHILTDWLQWYINSPYQNHDVYYNLVD